MEFFWQSIWSSNALYVACQFIFFSFVSAHSLPLEMYSTIHLLLLSNARRNHSLLSMKWPSARWIFCTLRHRQTRSEQEWRLCTPPDDFIASNLFIDRRHPSSSPWQRTWALPSGHGSPAAHRFADSIQKINSGWCANGPGYFLGGVL